MTKKRDRFFAAFGAILFLVTASALTIAVIVNGISNHNNPSTDQTSQSCTGTSVTASAESAPAVFKPTGTVKSLEKTDLQPGTGATVKSGDCLQVKYSGVVATTGSVFQENFDQATAFQFQIGQGQVIQGWDQGLIGIKVGGTRRLVIPAALAYGSTPPSGSGIPANADLVFTVKVLAVK